MALTFGRTLEDGSVGTVAIGDRTVRRLSFRAMRVSCARTVEGVCDLTLEQLRIAQELVEVVSVQNRYGVGNRTSEAVLAACEEQRIAFLPHSPLDRTDGAVGEKLAGIAAAHGALPRQVAIAWLLQHSPVMLPSPGTSQLSHAQENVDAAWLQLSTDELAELESAAAGPEQT